MVSGVGVALVGPLAVGGLTEGTEGEGTGLAERVVAELARQDRLVRDQYALVDNHDRATTVAAERVARLLGLRRPLRL